MRLTESPKQYIANAKPSQNVGYERLQREDARLFLETISTGVLRATRSEAEPAEQRKFIKTVSQTGAEFVVNLLNNGHEMGSAHGVEMGRVINQLQRADRNMFPGIPILENPTTGVRSAEVLNAMRVHAGMVAARSEQLPEHNRVNREDAALQVINAMSEMVETNPTGLQLDAQALEQMGWMAQAHDVAFPQDQ